MLDDEDEDVRYAATYWIGKKGDINLITKMLDDEDEYVRSIATKWIGERGDINLITKMLDDKDEKVRYRATYWIGERGDINLITKMLDDEDGKVRDIAADWIEKRKDEIRKGPLDIPPLELREDIISDYPTQAKKASVLDYVQETFDTEVWDVSDAKKGLPRLKDEAKKQIVRVLESVLKDNFGKILNYIKTIYIIGSITTQQWINESDIDVTIIIDMDLFKRLTKNEKLSDKDALELIRNAIIPYNGFLLLKTKHPVNYFIRSDDISLDVSDAVYDLKNDVWLKSPPSGEEVKVPLEEEKADIWNKAREWAENLDLAIGETKRDLIDYQTLLNALKQSPKYRTKLEELLLKKLEEINGDITKVVGEYEKIHEERVKAFESELDKGKMGLQDLLSKNWLPENLAYKLLERWRYLKLLKDLKAIQKEGITKDKLGEVNEVLREE
jgi:predicted nucleotidyltransferase